MALLKTLMQEHEKAILTRYLQENNDNRSRTAAVLGISRRGLLNKIKSHGLAQKGEDNVAVDTAVVIDPVGTVE